MFRGLFEGPGIWVVLIVVLLLFGATRLPALARSIGQSTKILRDEIKKPGDEADADEAAAAMSAGEPATVKPATVKPATTEAAPTKPAKAGKSGKPAKS